MSLIESTCPYCGVGCGLSVKIDRDDASKAPLILGSESHPANRTRLCSKGSALAQTINNDKQRLVAPQVAGRNVSWSEATDTVAQRIQDSIAKHGKESVAFYLSGQLLTEDYYVANKLMKGFIGTANVDTNSRLCMASAVAAYKRAFGSDAVPCCYEDLEISDLIVLIGSNAAWTHPVLYQRMQAAKEQNPNLKIVLIDPRKTVSCDIADRHLQIRTGTDGFLFQGLLNFLIVNKHINEAYINKHTEQFDDAKFKALEYDLQKTTSETGLSKGQLVDFFSLFANTEKVISFYSQGINQSATGTDKCNAIINCHLATGKIGCAGAGPFSITGQPNAMGGREVGGLASTLAAHMDFQRDDMDRVQRFWGSPTIADQAGLKAVDLFDAVYRGEIKVLWIMATNPAVSLPDSNHIRAALEQCETVIVSDVTQTDTTRYANILLPALTWGEKDGTVTNSERCISRQRSFLSAGSLVKPDWWALTQVAQKMGFAEQFNYQSSYEIFIEHARLSGFENTGATKRGFDLSGLANLDKSQYDSLAPIQWPVNAAAPHGTKRLFTDGHYFTDSGKAQFVSAHAKHTQAYLDAQQQELLFVLNSGRLRDQWHTMTRTGNAPSLTIHDELPYVLINPDDANRHGIAQNDFIKLTNEFGFSLARAEVSDDVSLGNLFMPIHWNDQFSSEGVLNCLTPQVSDPVSGQPESKASVVQIEKFKATEWARVLTHHPIKRQPQFSYWAVLNYGGVYVTLIASNQDINIRELISDTQPQSFSSYVNPMSSSESTLMSDADSINALFFTAKSFKELPSSVWLLDTMQNDRNLKEVIGDALRGELGGPDAVICSCFGTSRKAIEQVYTNDINANSLSTRLGCGSKCGSCKPELNLLLAQLHHKSSQSRV